VIRFGQNRNLASPKHPISYGYVIIPIVKHGILKYKSVGEENMWVDISFDFFIAKKIALFVAKSIATVLTVGVLFSALRRKRRQENCYPENLVNERKL